MPDTANKASSFLGSIATQPVIPKGRFPNAVQKAMPPLQKRPPDSTSYLWVVGVVLELLSDACGVAGKQLIRYSELKRADGKDTARNARRCGIALNAVCGPLLDLSAYSFAPQSIVAALGTLEIVGNALVAPAVLGEELSAKRGFGIALIAAGSVTAAIFGPKQDANYSLETIQMLLLRKQSMVYACALVGWLGILGSSIAWHRPGDKVRGFSLSALAGSLSGNMFCDKMISELMWSTVVHRKYHIWSHSLPYVVSAGSVFFNVSNAWFLVKSMEECEALYASAIFAGSERITASVSGAMVLSELDNLTTASMHAYWASLTVVIAGVGVVILDGPQSGGQIAPQVHGSASTTVSSSTWQPSTRNLGAPMQVRHHPDVDFCPE